MHHCKKCNKQFNTIQSLSAHQRIHSLKMRSGVDIQKMVELSKQKYIERIAKYYETPLFCKQCNVILPYKKFLSRNADRKHTQFNNTFCSKSCSAKYNNTHKTYGTRRSKFEKYAENTLTKLYPTLEIHFNRKDTISSELDIYIPSLQLAIEINGIHHYKAIYSEQVFKNVKQNDISKVKICAQKGIKLHIIDISTLVYFTPKNADRYSMQLINIIDSNSNFNV